MTVFKTYLKIFNQYKLIVILYTVILLVFAIFQMKNNENSLSFEAEKPNIYIDIQDENIGLTKNLVDYLSASTNVVSVDDVSDALFFREVHFVITIPNSYRKDLLSGKNPSIHYQSTNDYQASLVQMLLEKYLRIQSIFLSSTKEESKTILSINNVLNQKATFTMNTHLDTYGLTKAKNYYNFANYAILAGLIYVVCVLNSVFRDEKILKRTKASSKNFKTFNCELFLSNSLFAILLWGLYVLFSFFLVGNVMFSIHGYFYIFNAFLFTMVSLSIAFFIGSFLKNKEAINGIVNVIALGSSFLCGAFVPISFLPKSVLYVVRIFPSYWFIQNNELLSTLEVIDSSAIRTLFFHFTILFFFLVFFLILTNILSKKNLQKETI